MISKKDIDNSNIFEWVFVFFGILIILFYLVAIFQEGFGFLFTPTAHDSLNPGIPHIFIFLLGFIIIVFPLKRITSKKKTRNDP